LTGVDVPSYESEAHQGNPFRIIHLNGNLNALVNLSAAQPAFVGKLRIS